MPVYRAFIDDSASEDSLFREDMSPKPVQKMDGTPEEKGSVAKAAAAGMVVVRGSHMDAIHRELMGLRWQLHRKYKFNSEQPPRIHMRHLWGKIANYDKGRNPFYSLSESERFRVARSAYELLSHLQKTYDLTSIGENSDNKITQESWGEFFNSPKAKVNREIIYLRFRGNQNARRFYARITNPTMSIVAHLVTQFAHFLNEGNHQGIIRYDTSDASKGFEADEVYDVIGELGWCKTMSHSSHGNNYDESLLQIADLVSFASFRAALNHARGLGENGDQAFSRLVNGIEFRPPILRTQPPRFMGIGVHYLSAREFLHGIDPVWVDTHLKTPAELVHEFNMDKPAFGGGVHIVREESYDFYLKNGRLP